MQALEAVSAALGELTISVADGVQALIDNSLVHYVVLSEGEPRLTFMEVIRQYAQIRLEESGELDQARDAHADYYLELAKEAESDEYGADQFTRQKRLEYEELTAREIQVLRLLALGLSNKQIAGRLIISPHSKWPHSFDLR